MAIGLLVGGLLAAGDARAGLDRDGNGLNDAWVWRYGAHALDPHDDDDGDGATNAEESAAGTDPFNPLSVPRLFLVPATAPDVLTLRWEAIAGKRYTLSRATNLIGQAWSPVTDFTTLQAATPHVTVSATSPAAFFRQGIADRDQDGDGLTDYEELLLGFDPMVAHTDRFPDSDYARVTNAWDAPSLVSIAALQPWMHEGWPDPGRVVVRRSGGLAPLTIGIAFGGDAEPGVDYHCAVSHTVDLPMGAREIWIDLFPVKDDLPEPTEAITVALLPGVGYLVGAPATAALTLDDAGPDGRPGVREAARFLIQAAFGPDADVPGDGDDIPENVKAVMALGFEGWLDDQVARPLGLHRPMAEWLQTHWEALGIYTDIKITSWWGRAMGTPRLTPDHAEPQAPDPLRQRMAFALSQILVVSDRPETLGVQPVGMTDYYDLLVRHALGNYGDLLLGVALHPCMGTYLSHIGNRKADPANHVYPDENFARELMQLFTIGLWQLHPDGTHMLDAAGQSIPTYDNDDITELARVFTGLGMGGTNNTFFAIFPPAFTVPMKMWDAHHDCDPKILLGGLALPARFPSAGNTGDAGLADVAAAVSNLFHHPNVGPFVGRQLIQRLVTSNPSPAYVARVAAAFGDNGAGERGDLAAVARAILLDPEARDPAVREAPGWGKLREPFLRVVNLARAFNAASTSGIYALDSFHLDHAQMPLNAPSVFNFYLPTHSPPGALTAVGLTAPEFQIVNASTAISAANYFWNSVWNGLNRWGMANPDHRVLLQLDAEMALVVPAAQIHLDVPPGPRLDPDPLLRRLDLVLTGGVLRPAQFQIARETLLRMPTNTWQWHRHYLRTAIYLIMNSPEFNVLR